MLTQSCASALRRPQAGGSACPAQASCGAAPAPRLEVGQRPSCAALVAAAGEAEQHASRQWLPGVCRTTTRIGWHAPAISPDRISVGQHKSITWSKPSCLQRLYILWWRIATGSAVVVSSIPPLSVLKMWRRGDCQDGVLMATEEQWRVRRGSQAQQQPWRRLQRCQVQPGPPGLLRHGRCCQFTDPCQLPAHLSQRPTCSVSRRRRAGECDYGIHYIRIRVLATDAASNAGPAVTEPGSWCKDL